MVMKLPTKLKQVVFFFTLLMLFLALKFCCPKEVEVPNLVENSVARTAIKQDQHLKEYHIYVNKDVSVEDYFPYIDSLVKTYDSLTPYKLSEHLLVRSNPWIIDSLKHTDYYRMMVLNSFVYDQKKLIVLPKNASILIPDSIVGTKLLTAISKIWLDINIPEFKLRIYEDSLLLHTFPIRVGKNQKKFLAMAGRTLDLKTITGTGRIVNHVKNPDYYNPVDGKQYFATKRDDQKVTKLPQIPFMVTEINGIRNGQLIHPTTNPITLGKAYSNGCVGVGEGDAWVIYYYSPIGTKVHIRYDLTIINEEGQSVNLEDIYGYQTTTANK